MKKLNRVFLTFIVINTISIIYKIHINTTIKNSIIEGGIL